MAIDNVSFSNLVTQNILNSHQSSVTNASTGHISTEDFENVLTQYLTSYTNQTSKKSSPLATALGADDALIEELLTSSSGRKAITQMTSNHLMDIVTSANALDTSAEEDKITALEEAASNSKAENTEDAEVSSDTISLTDTFTSLADLLQSATLRVNTN